MELKENQKEEIKEKLLENYDSYNCGLAEMMNTMTTLIWKTW